MARTLDRGGNAVVDCQPSATSDVEPRQRQMSNARVLARQLQHELPDEVRSRVHEAIHDGTG